MEKFRDISEAWSILSRPDLRQRYDSERLKNFGSAIGNINRATQQNIEMFDSYNTQKNNFKHVQKMASSNWREIQDKYKTEKWQQLSLKEKKVMLTFF